MPTVPSPSPTGPSPPSSPTAPPRDLSDQLPLSLTFRDFNRVEKVAELPRPLTMDGVPVGDDPAVNDIMDRRTERITLRQLLRQTAGYTADLDGTHCGSFGLKLTPRDM